MNIKQRNINQSINKFKKRYKPENDCGKDEKSGLQALGLHKIKINA